ncbi:amidase [Aurantiacibacter rhizosphaerae]|uniref:Amidase n=1 Tax=Aurantiacibacter rhizosphaerae TaxID=2691582 RepID=A0A844XF09_9SPHN|nr:amidase [Aurantiacibacter rhizosphaerae]MWV29067.1 amidase [Aurantiacibacter rhizosphaerae]
MSSFPGPLDDSAVLITSLDLGERGGPRVAVKDCLDIAGHVTSCGSRALADAAPAQNHADVVQALIDAGCHIIGKANMHELAYGVTGQNEFTGTPPNPEFPDRIVGGSSSGSAAAVAAGLADFAIGTDTGGSIRMPAACCGIIGLKPTFGSVSRTGAIPASSSLDCIGPFAATMDQLIAAMEAIYPGFTLPAAPDSLRLKRVTVEADLAVTQALDAALARVDAQITQIELPHFADAHAAGMTIIAGEMAAELGHLVGSGKLGADIDARLAAAGKITAAQMEEAESIRSCFTAKVDAALADCDALVLPTLPSEPILVSEASDAAAAVKLTRLVRPFNLSGHPAITLPVMTQNRLPAGVQLVGRKGEDAALCALARELEKQISLPAAAHRPGNA